MRGKVVNMPHLQVKVGITPAYAGKRQFCPPAGRTDKDHPRMCGEKMMKAGSNCAMLGSPPRMRGKAELGHAQQLLSGITPAYAGKSLKFCERCALGKDHPRVCGEKLTRHLTASGGRGSPPRMRGKVLAALVLPSPTRITPAYAGKSVAHFGLMQLVRDHPRVCGEKLFLPEPHPVGTGSPPRMRGKVIMANIYSLYNRITPAYAGKSRVHVT